VVWLVRWDTVKVRDRFSGMVRFKSGLKCNGRVNSVVIDVTKKTNYFFLEAQCKTCTECTQ